LTHITPIVKSSDLLASAVKLITEDARQIIGAHQCLTRLAPAEDSDVGIYTISLSQKYEAWANDDEQPNGKGIYATVTDSKRPLRLTCNELKTHPEWCRFDSERDRHPPLLGLLAVPLLSREGKCLGVIQLSDKYDGEFSAADEATLVQLMRVAAVTIEVVQLAGQQRVINEKFRTAFTNSVVGIAITDAHGQFSEVSEAFMRITGYSLKELRKMNSSALTHPLDQAQDLALNVRMMSGEISNFVIDKRYIRKDGTVIWVKKSGSVIRDFAGKPVSRAALVEDITQQRDAEQALRESEKRYRRIVEASQDIICTIDKSGAFVELSPRCKVIWGYEPSEMIGQKFLDFVRAEDRDSSAAEVLRIAGGRSTTNFENQYNHKDGRTIRMLWSAAWSNEDQLFFAIGRDITERWEMEQRMHQSQRLEAVGQLTGGVAHDFNNLLTVILGNAELLSEHLKDKPHARALAEMTRAAAERGADLTRRLLAFSRRQPLIPKIVDVGQLIGSMNGLLTRTLGGHVKFTLRQADNLWPANVDPTQFEAALLNLCINARDAMPHGGTLTVETANAPAGASNAEIFDDVAPGDYICVFVTDTGEGMTPQTQARAFEPFFTTKDVGKGSGLGLSMVYSFVKQSGGQIRIFSEVGKGTSIRLCLPRANGEASKPAPAEPAASGVGGQESILLVEDDDLVRAHVTRQLTEMGYRIHAVGDAAAALDALERNATFDLMFTDIIMPGGISGEQLAEMVRTLRPGLPVLFTSGYSGTGIAPHGSLDRDVHMLKKPYSRRELASMIRTTLDQGKLPPVTA